MSETDPVPESGLGLDVLRGFIPGQLPSDQGRGLQPSSKIDLKEHEAKTARTLTFVLVGMLGLSFVIHETLVVLMTLHNKAEVIPTLEHTFNEWLPVLAGLVGTAVGFYLKERK